MPDSESQEIEYASAGTPIPKASPRARAIRATYIAAAIAAVLLTCVIAASFVRAPVLVNWRKTGYPVVVGISGGVFVVMDDHRTHTSRPRLTFELMPRLPLPFVKSSIAFRFGSTSASTIVVIPLWPAVLALAVISWAVRRRALKVCAAAERWNRRPTGGANNVHPPH